MSNNLISVVIPCFNEEDVIEETITRLTNFLNGLAGYDFELLFVDDGSSDRTADLISRNAKNFSKIKLIKLSRNFGHQSAVSAGIDYSKGDAVVLIDADLQDPPEVISQFIEKWKIGYKVVYATRLERTGESKFKLITARLFYRALNSLSEVAIPRDTGDFRLMDRVVVDVLKSMPERDRFLRGMISWVGFPQTSVLYSRDKRFAGVSKYPLMKMIRFATDGILSFSTKPLKASMALGFMSAFAAFIGVLYSIVIRLYTTEWVPGWAALMISILFIGGVQLISIGILGEYVGRIYGESKGRPRYVVEEIQE